MFRICSHDHYSSVLLKSGPNSHVLVWNRLLFLQRLIASRPVYHEVVCSLTALASQILSSPFFLTPYCYEFIIEFYIRSMWWFSLHKPWYTLKLQHWALFRATKRNSSSSYRDNALFFFHYLKHIFVLSSSVENTSNDAEIKFLVCFKIDDRKTLVEKRWEKEKKNTNKK